ncbi:MAG: CsgG/HfaB family protein, partial [Hyphomicrobium sp.]
MGILKKVILSIGLFVCAASLGGCAGHMAESAAAPSEGLLPPVLNPITKINKSLRELPPPVQKVAIAVYGYTDQTGQFKPVDNVQTLSRAVTQGATSVLIKALQDAGEGAWFTVVERERLDNLMKERKIIADMRERYLG